MQTRPFGRSGLKTSRLAFGTWKNLGERVTGTDADRLIRAAVDAGVTTFDTADVYGRAEETLGATLPHLNRRDLVVITKCFWPVGPGANDRGLSRKHIVESLDRSLSRLRLDYVDVLMCHRHDPDTPLAETMRAFDDLIRQGKILYWGTSEWPVAALDQAFDLAGRYGWAPPVVEQSEYSLLHRRRVELDLAALRDRHGLGLMGWSPLASGVLAGRHLEGGIEDASLLSQVGDGLRAKYTAPAVLDRARALRDLAAQAGIDMAELALRATLALPTLDCVALGMSSPSQLARNLAALAPLPDDLHAQVLALFRQTGSLS